MPVVARGPEEYGGDCALRLREEDEPRRLPYHGDVRVPVAVLRAEHRDAALDRRGWFRVYGFSRRRGLARGEVSEVDTGSALSVWVVFDEFLGGFREGQDPHRGPHELSHAFVAFVVDRPGVAPVPRLDPGFHRRGLDTRRGGVARCDWLLFDHGGRWVRQLDRLPGLGGRYDVEDVDLTPDDTGGVRGLERGREIGEPRPQRGERGERHRLDRPNSL